MKVDKCLINVSSAWLISKEHSRKFGGTLQHEMALQRLPADGRQTFVFEERNTRRIDL